MDKILLKVPEVAEMIGLGRSKAYQLMGSGELASVRVGRARRIPTEAVRKWVADQSAAEERSRRERPPANDRP